MFKVLIPSLILFANISFANTSDPISEIEKCEKAYDICSAKCEQNENSDNNECFSKCEEAFDTCQSKIKDEDFEGSQPDKNVQDTLEENKQVDENFQNTEEQENLEENSNN